MIDEGLSSSDKKNIQHVLEFLDKLAREFYTTMIITHNDVLQINIEKQLNIERINNYSQINNTGEKFESKSLNIVDEKSEDKLITKINKKTKQESDIITCDVCKVSVLKKNWKGHIKSAAHLKNTKA